MLSWSGPYVSQCGHLMVGMCKRGCELLYDTDVPVAIIKGEWRHYVVFRGEYAEKYIVVPESEPYAFGSWGWVKPASVQEMVDEMVVQSCGVLKL